MNINDLAGPQLGRLQRNALIAALLGLVLCVASVLISALNGGSIRGGAERFFESYLFAFMFWFGLTTGSLALLMVHHVTGGGWGFIIRRLLEAATRNLPLVLALFVPILFGIPHLYEWSNPEEVAHDKLLQLKQPYLNVPFFVIRAVLYFAVWMALAYFLNKWSRQQDESDDPRLAHRLNLLSAVGLLAYVLTLTFASFDWVMSLTPHWFSSLFGVIFIVGQGLSTLAMMSVMVAALAGRSELVQRVEPRYFRDLGNLTLAFTLLWAYTNFSQYMIYWSGNIVEEVEWYVERTRGVWLGIGAFLCVFHFFFPFFCLLSSSLKVKITNLAKLGLFLLLMRHLDLYWYVVPTFRHEFSFALSDVGAPLLIGGIWLWAWAREVKDRQVVPALDPRLKEYWPAKLQEVAHHV